MVILENIDIDIDIDKAILQNIDIDKISNRFKFGISNRASSRGSRSGRDEKSGLLCLSSAQGLYLGTWCTVLSLHFDPVRDFKCDIFHLSRTYGRAISVRRLAGAPIKMTIARFAMKNFLFCTISSGWQPEKLRLGEEVVHSKA